MKSSAICNGKTFLVIQNKYAGIIRNFLFYRFGSLEIARICTQKAFAKLWDNCDKVAFEKAKGYLFAISNRRFSDYSPDEKTTLRFKKLPHQKTNYTLNQEQAYPELGFKEKLEVAVSNLADKLRIVFLLSRIDKLSNKDIATALGTSTKTIDRYLTQALVELKEQMDQTLK